MQLCLTQGRGALLMRLFFTSLLSHFLPQLTEADVAAAGQCWPLAPDGGPNSNHPPHNFALYFKGGGRGYFPAAVLPLPAVPPCTAEPAAVWRPASQQTTAFCSSHVPLAGVSTFCLHCTACHGPPGICRDARHAQKCRSNLASAFWPS